MTAAQGSPRCAAPIGGTFPNAVRCPNPARIRIPCPSCGYIAWACSPEHTTGAWQVCYGHQLREHPETMPAELERLRNSPDKLAALAAAERQRPGTFAKIPCALHLHQPSSPAETLPHPRLPIPAPHSR